MVFSKPREAGRSARPARAGSHSRAGPSPFKQSQFARYFELWNPCFLKIVVICPCTPMDFVIIIELSNWYVMKTSSQGTGQLPATKASQCASSHIARGVLVT